MAEPAALWSRAGSSALPAAVKRNDKQEYPFSASCFVKLQYFPGGIVTTDPTMVASLGEMSPNTITIMHIPRQVTTHVDVAEMLSQLANMVFTMCWKCKCLSIGGTLWDKPGWLKNS